MTFDVKKFYDFNGLLEHCPIPTVARNAVFNQTVPFKCNTINIFTVLFSIPFCPKKLKGKIGTSCFSCFVRKPFFCLGKYKGAGQLLSNCVFATQIVLFLFLNLKFPLSRHLLCLYSSVCVRPNRKPRRPVFSHRGLF